MLLFSSKKHVFRTQIRQFVTFYTRTRASMKERPLNHCVEWKYSNVMSQNRYLHRLFNTKDSDEQTVRIEPLMRLPNAFPQFSPFLLLFSYCYVRLNIDRDFRLLEVCEGAAQAITLTLDALATQKYEMLDGMINERSLKVLKHRVNRLTPAQRQLLGFTRLGIICVPNAIIAKSCKEKNEQRVEVKLSGILYASSSPTFEINRDILFFCYTFERKYINSIGKSWIIKIANHFSVDAV